MKNASANLIALLGSTRNLLMADNWKITLKNGTVLRYTTWDQNLTDINNYVFAASDVILTGGKIKQVRGLEVNETDLTCYPNLGVSPSMVGNIPFLQAAVQGLFDRATIERWRVFMPSPGVTVSGGQDMSVRIFLGEITEVNVTRNTCILKCKDATNLLNIYMPRRQYQPTCSWTFGDSNCTINRAALAVTSSVAAGSAYTSILCGLTQVAGYFNYGTVTFTSGNNENITRQVLNSSPGTVTLTGPFPQPLNVGDNFTITPGCSKNLAGPTQSFNGAATDGNTPQIIVTNLGTPAGAYNGLTMEFTSGTLSGQSQTIAQWQITLLGGGQGIAVMQNSFTTTPAEGDTFVIDVPFNPFNPGNVNGSVAGLLTQSVIPTNLTNADGFFSGGTIQITSGVDLGWELGVTTWVSGVAILASSLPNVPAIGDEFTLTTAPAAAMNTCTYYNNTINFGGEPYIPIPETAY